MNIHYNAFRIVLGCSYMNRVFDSNIIRCWMKKASEAILESSQSIASKVEQQTLTFFKLLM